MDALDLHLHDAFVGTVTPDTRNRQRVVLNVDPTYQANVLLTESFAVLPGKAAPVVEASNFLGGYVPEGNHRTTMARKRGIDPDDLFAFLREFGGSVAGAVTLSSSAATQTSASRYESLSDTDVARLLKQALRETDQAVPDDSRSALPGYQPKVLLAAIGGEWMAPHGSAHSTHILKPQLPARPERIFDEAYGYLLAHRLGFADYACEIRRAGPMEYLSIERFDRIVEDDQVSLVHQEDLAQAMALDWVNSDVKFQSPEWRTDDRRASAQRVAELLGTLPNGSVDIETWVRYLIFQVAVGNNDAHAKNFALMHTAEGTQLAQLYDVVPNLFQDGRITWDMALAIDGVFDHRKMSVERMSAEASSWGVVAAQRTEEIIAQTLAAVDAAAGEIEPPKGVSPGMPEQIQWNIDRLRKGLEISAPKRSVS